MSAIAIRVAAELRRRWRAWLGLALLAGVFGGVVLAAFAGARRTETAYPRFLKSQNAYDMFLLDFSQASVASQYPFQAAAFSIDDVAKVPHVTAVVREFFFQADERELIGSPDPRFDTTVNRPKLIAGRLPDQSRTDEIAVPVAIADRMHARPGGQVTFHFIPAGGGDARVAFTFTIAGIIAEPGEFPPESDLGPPTMHLTRAFVLANSATLAADPAMLVRLEHGPDDVAQFRRDLGARFGGKPVIGFTQNALTKNVTRSFDLQAAALWIVGLFLAVAALLVVGQTISRQTALDGLDNPTLRGLGMTQRQLVWIGVIRAGIIGGVGAVVAAALAFLLSPLSPTGLARAAEPAPGFRFDAFVIAAGGAVVLLAIVGMAILPAYRAARARAEGFSPALEPERARVSRTASMLARYNAPASAVVGIRFALEPGSGTTAVPVRSSTLGAALGLAALAMAFTFGSGLDHLLATPRLYGVQWDAVVGLPDDGLTPQSAPDAVALSLRDPDVEAAAPSALGFPFVIDGVPADAMALPATASSFFPTLFSGRLPLSRDEIVVGARTLRLIHKRVGDTVGVSATGVPAQTFRIVGVGALPTVGHTANLGEGSLVTPEGSAQVFPSSGATDQIVVRFKPGVDRPAALGRLGTALGAAALDIATPTTPGDLVSFGRSQNLPFLLAGVLALLAAGTIAHVLLTGIARRRRDLALLKTLGFVRRQVGGAVAWQSTALVVAALVFALPAGVAAGRWLWATYATQLGVISEPRVPMGTIVLIVPGALALANLISIAPARIAARTPAAVVLRSE